MALFKKKEKAATDPFVGAPPQGDPQTAAAPQAPAPSVAPAAPSAPRAKADSYTYILLASLLCLVVSLVYLILLVEKLKSEGHKPLVRMNRPVPQVVLTLDATALC